MLSGRVWWDVLRPFSGQVHFWDQKAAGIIRRSTHDAAAQALVPGGGLGRCRPYPFRERLVVSGLPDETGYRPCRALIGPSVGDVRCFLARIKPKTGLRRTREVLLGEIASLDETERWVWRATELRFGLFLGVLGKNAPGPRYAAGSAVVEPL